MYVDLTLSLNPSFLSLKMVCLFNSLKLMRKNKQDFASSAQKTLLKKRFANFFSNIWEKVLIFHYYIASLRPKNFIDKKCFNVTPEGQTNKADY